MSMRKSVNRLILGGAVAALLAGGAAIAQVKAPSFTGHGPVTPPEDPGLCMAKNALNPNKWSICGVTPPKNRNITVANAQGLIVRAHFTDPGGTDVQKTLASGQTAVIPILVNQNATIEVQTLKFSYSHLCTVHSAEHGSGDIMITVTATGTTATCLTAP
jgi:hypothetical protein